jgi:hypothetical protein
MIEAVAWFAAFLIFLNCLAELARESHLNFRRRQKKAIQEKKMEILEPRVSKKDKVDTERRGEIRLKALKSAKLAFNAGYGAMECVVRNVSKSGARLTFAYAVGVPNHFSIRISDDPVGRDAVVRWRMGHMVGVEFEPS